jgi:transmembrane sensor
MSDNQDQLQSVSAAKDVRVQASRWRERRDREDFGSADQAELDAWLAQSPDNMVAYLRVDDAWSRADRLGALRRPTRPVGPERRVLIARIAAALGLAAVLGVVAYSEMDTPVREHTYATAIGNREQIRLADGSEIELNTDTTLRTRITPQERRVWLDKGEAYFNIRHDAAHPFIVMAGTHRVTDLGTKFFVRHDNDRLEVAVMEGKAQVDANGKTDVKPAVLLPGDVVVATASSILETKKSVQDLSDKLGWRQGMLVFHHTTLADAAAEFNRYNREKIVIGDTAIARLTINGTFPSRNVGDYTHLTQEVFGLHVEKQGDIAVLSR